MTKTHKDEAYEKGFKDGKNGNFLDDFAHSLSTVVPGPDTNDAEIHRKGYDEGRKHRGDDSDSSSSGSGCYLSTACVEAMGLQDNCFELAALRSFRDNVLMQQPSGRSAVREYCKIAPEIVSAIENQRNAKEIWHALYRDIRHAVSLVLAGDFERAFRHYQQMTLRLSKTYLD